jgi:hypothetical protein
VLGAGGTDQEDQSLKPAWANSSCDPTSKNPSQKRAGGVAQGVGPEFKPQYHHIKKERKEEKTLSVLTLGKYIPKLPKRQAFMIRTFKSSLLLHFAQEMHIKKKKISLKIANILLKTSLSSIQFFKFYFTVFYIYLHVYTLFGPSLPSPPPAFGENLFNPLVLQFC